MAHIDTGRSAFQADPGPEPGREPWRMFKSSLAITFTSKRQRVWCPDALSPEVRSQIIRSIEARVAIAAAEMELGTTIRDFVREANALISQYSPPAWPQPDSELRKAAKWIARKSAALSAQRDELLALLDKLDEGAARLDLLAKGFLEVREERSGSISMTFSLDRRLALEPRELEREARTIRYFVNEAIGVLHGARDALMKKARTSESSTGQVSGKEQGSGD